MCFIFPGKNPCRFIFIMILSEGRMQNSTQNNDSLLTPPFVENVTSLVTSIDTISEKDSSTIKIDAADVARFLLSTDFGQNPDGLTDTLSKELFNNYISNTNENDGKMNWTTSQGNMMIKSSRENPPTFTEKTLKELLKILGHLWGDPKDVGIHYQGETQGVTDTYYRMGILPFELDRSGKHISNTFAPTEISLNINPTIFVTSVGNTTVNPWNTEGSQDGIATVLSSSETNCISRLVEASHWCYLYGVGFLLIIALLLNGLSLVVFQAKPLRKLPFSVYLSALSITDTIALFGHIPRKWLNVLYLSMGWETGITFYDTNTVACKALTFISYAFRFLSSWLLVGLACDRLVVSSNPYKPSKFRTIKSARHAILCCIIGSLIFNCHVLFTWKSVTVPNTLDQTRSCVPLATSDFISISLTITTISTIVGLPFLIISAVTIFTIRNIGTWSMRPRRLSTRAICRALLEKQATSMVVAVSGMFCILSVPYTLSWAVLLVQHFASASTSMCQYIEISAARDISEVGFMSTYALKFLICIFTGRNVLTSR